MPLSSPQHHITTPTYPSNPSEYELLEDCGRGTSAIVSRALCKPLDEIVAIKRCQLDSCQGTLSDLIDEAHYMRNCDHPNILKLHTAFVAEEELWLVMPYMEGGSVAHIMQYAHPGGLKEKVIATIMQGVLRGLEYVHEDQGVHRDVKAGNILLGADGSVELADFGVSSQLERSAAWGRGVVARKTLVGTPCWMAPEVMEQANGYDSSADIWSFGITMLELAYGHAPFAHHPPLKVLMMTLTEPPPELEPQVGQDHYSKSMRKVVALCLQKDPSKRPTARQLLEHKFFRLARDKEYLVKHLLAGLPPLHQRVQHIRSGRAATMVPPRAKIPQQPHTPQAEDVCSWDFSLTRETAGHATEPARQLPAPRPDVCASAPQASGDADCGNASSGAGGRTSEPSTAAMTVGCELQGPSVPPASPTVSLSEVDSAHLPPAMAEGLPRAASQELGAVAVSGSLPTPRAGGPVVRFVSHPQPCRTHSGGSHPEPEGLGGSHNGAAASNAAQFSRTGGSGAGVSSTGGSGGGRAAGDGVDGCDNALAHCGGGIENGAGVGGGSATSASNGGDDSHGAALTGGASSDSSTRTSGMLESAGCSGSTCLDGSPSIRQAGPDCDGSSILTGPESRRGSNGGVGTSPTACQLQPRGLSSVPSTADYPPSLASSTTSSGWLPQALCGRSRCSSTSSDEGERNVPCAPRRATAYNPGAQVPVQRGRFQVVYEEWRHETRPHRPLTKDSSTQTSLPRVAGGISTGSPGLCVNCLGALGPAGSQPNAQGRPPVRTSSSPGDKTQRMPSPSGRPRGLQRRSCPSGSRDALSGHPPLSGAGGSSGSSSSSSSGSDEDKDRFRRVTLAGLMRLGRTHPLCWDGHPFESPAHKAAHVGAAQREQEQLESQARGAKPPRCCPDPAPMQLEAPAAAVSYQLEPRMSNGDVSHQPEARPGAVRHQVGLLAHVLPHPTEPGAAVVPPQLPALAVAAAGRQLVPPSRVSSWQMPTPGQSDGEGQAGAADPSRLAAGCAAAARGHGDCPAAAGGTAPINVPLPGEESRPPGSGAAHGAGRLGQHAWDHGEGPANHDSELPVRSPLPPCTKQAVPRPAGAPLCRQAQLLVPSSWPQPTSPPVELWRLQSGSGPLQEGGMPAVGGTSAQRPATSTAAEAKSSTSGGDSTGSRDRGSGGDRAAGTMRGVSTEGVRHGRFQVFSCS